MGILHFLILEKTKTFPDIFKKKKKKEVAEAK